MLILFLFGLFLGGASVETQHYAICKEHHFSSQSCAFEKKLCVENNSVQSCK